MEKIEIEKVYIKKINELKKCNEAYFKEDKPIVSDKDYDDIKEEILNLEKKYNFLKSKDSPSQKIGYAPSTKFKKIKHLKPMLSLANAFEKEDMKDFLSKIGMFLTFNFNAHKNTRSSYDEQKEIFFKKTKLIKKKLSIFGITDIYYSEFKLNEK